MNDKWNLWIIFTSHFNKSFHYGHVWRICAKVIINIFLPFILSLFYLHKPTCKMTSDRTWVSDWVLFSAMIFPIYIMALFSYSWRESFVLQTDIRSLACFLMPSRLLIFHSVTNAIFISFLISVFTSYVCSPESAT